jgi:hypothetical protein|nr:MAG TPA: hypothetical protein [Bacteriophage sp.]
MSMAEVIKSLEHEALREAQSQKLCSDISGGYSTKTPCISKDDSIPEWLRKNVEKKLRNRFKGR